ncbi:Gamma-aminobutyric acid type B receptor subunit 2-like [Oopsacas minuta]|uniref:Gamma-aminobutyric acid type B receptor subunit 2-like n=1 Tax=Oopsacas minuta TaxID=111878 RepID=A0AAV7K022_9METZ|nr:Gamma-aminobutyric acid type B receptor subunit 2-like [Oopsacas minuta]
MRNIGEFAKDLINNSTNILPDCQLNIDWKNSQCQSNAAVNEIQSFLQDQGVIYHFVLGPACSISAEPVGQIIPNFYLNMMAYSAASPDLTTDSYPNTFLGVVTFDANVVIWVKLIQFYQWRRVAIIGQDTGLFNTVNLNFGEQLNELSVSFDIARIIEGEEKEIDTMLSRIFQTNEYKIVFGNFYEGEGYKVLCRAYLMGYIYPYVTWVLPGWWASGWIERGESDCQFCEGCDINAALKGALGVDSLSTLEQLIINNDDTVLNLKQQEIWNMFAENNVVTDANIEKYLPYTFDSLLSFALALNASLQNGIDLSQFNYHRADNASINSEIVESLKNSLAGVDFAGLTGEVNYQGRARKYSNGELSEYENDGNFKSLITIPNVGGNLSSSLEGSSYIDFNTLDFEYFGMQAGPLDGVELHHLPISAIVISVIFAFCALIFSVFFLVFNIIFNKKKVIRYSNPILNSFILIGACLQCGVAILVLIDNRILQRTPEQQRNNEECIGCTILCHLVWWVPALATDIIFGTLVGKSVRIYSIVIRKSLENKVKLIYIILFIGGLMLFDTVYTVIWIAIEALRFQFIAEGPLQTDLPNIKQPGAPFWYIFYCAEGGDPSSPAIAVRFVYILFRWILYGVGLYFAFQIRKVNIRGVNEFQSITLATLVTIFFNLVRIILITMIPSVRLIDTAITLLSISYALDAIFVIGFIFVPKLYFIVRDPHQKKNYTGVNNVSTIDYSAIYKMQITKIQGELEIITTERDALLSKMEMSSPTSESISMMNPIFGDIDKLTAKSEPEAGVNVIENSIGKNELPEN